MTSPALTAPSPHAGGPGDCQGRLAGAGRLSLTAGGWRVVAAVVTGPAHRRTDRRGDDAVAVDIAGGRLVAVVADGAGSATRGGEGAALIAELLVAALRWPVPLTGLRRRVGRALREAGETIARIAGSDGREALRSTALGVVARGGHGLLFHVGDGAGLAFGAARGRGAPTLRAISPGETGEHAGETVFATDVGAERHLRFFGFSRAGGLVLMTDGTTPFALARGGRGPAAAFMAPVLAFLDRHDGPVAARALEHLLDRDDARRVSADDKTLLWAWRSDAGQGGS